MDAPADRRLSRCDQHPGDGAVPGGRALGRGGRATHHRADRTTDGRTAESEAGAVPLAGRALAGRGRVRGRGRSVLCAAGRLRAAHGGARVLARGGRARTGAAQHRSGRDLPVHRRGRQPRRDGTANAAGLVDRPATPGPARRDRGEQLRRIRPAGPRDGRSATPARVRPHPARSGGRGPRQQRQRRGRVHPEGLGAVLCPRPGDRGVAGRARRGGPQGRAGHAGPPP